MENKRGFLLTDAKEFLYRPCKDDPSIAFVFDAETGQGMGVWDMEMLEANMKKEPEQK